MLVPTIWKPNFNTWMFSSSSVDILDDMLAGVGWTMHDYLKYGANDYYPPLPNGHRLFLHDIRRVAVRAAVAMGEEGDIVVSFWSHTLLLPLFKICTQTLNWVGKSHTIQLIGLLKAKKKWVGWFQTTTTTTTITRSPKLQNHKEIWEWCYSLFLSFWNHNLF